MNLNPAKVLDPVFHFLDSVIENYGVYLYLGLVWLALLLIAWIFSGGLRRRSTGQQHLETRVGIVLRPPPESPTPTAIDQPCDLSPDDEHEVQ
jgi:hypothetical protein